MYALYIARCIYECLCNFHDSHIRITVGTAVATATERDTRAVCMYCYVQNIVHVYVAFSFLRRDKVRLVATAFAASLLHCADYDTHIP
jgi:hypothetical protein